MARLLSLYERVRNWFLVLIGLLIGVQIGVQPTNASATKPVPAIPERVAAVRNRMQELQKNPAVAEKKNDKGEATLVAQWGNWGNWNNWRNWGNWSSWNNWGNWGNY
jgi:hypothetical protein